MLFFKNAQKRSRANRSKENPIFILSCDGVGSRGIIIAEVLRTLEEELRMYGSARALADSFDMYVATSTSSVIMALLLATEIPTSEISSCLSEKLFPFLAPNDQSVRVLGESYTPKFHNESLLERFHQLFGSCSFSLLKKPCVIPLYDTLHTRPHTMISTQEPNAPLNKVLLASCSVPEFFAPVQVSAHELSSHKEARMIDGSVYGVNPLLNGILSVYNMCGASSDIYVLSIGGGEVPVSRHRDSNDVYTTFLPQAHTSSFFHALYNAHAQNTVDLLSKIDNIHLTRINAHVTRTTSNRFFDFSPEYAEFLKLNAIDFIHRNRIAIKQFAQKIITIKDKA